MLSFFFVSTSTSSSNAPPSVCTDYPDSEVVFLGTLSAFTPEPLLSPMTFQSLEPLWGESGYSITVLRGNGSLCHAPDPPVIGERYFVISVFVGGKYSCSELKREADATPDIQYFRQALSGATATQISGEVRVMGKGTPVRGAKVLIAGASGQKELITNAKGRFQAVLKPGTYDVITQFPTGYEPAHCGGESVTVVEHRCSQLVICALPKASTELQLSRNWQ